MGDDQPPLETGWQPGTPRRDTLARAAVLAHADAFEHTARSRGGRVRRDQALVLADTGCPNFFFNTAFLLQPALGADFDLAIDRIEAFFGPRVGGGVLLCSPWPTPVPRRPGWELVGHPPLMLHLPGGSPRPRPPELRVDEAVDDELLSAVEAVLIEGYPLHELRPPRPGCLFDGRLLEADNFRCWVGSVGGRPISASAAYLDPDITAVTWLATLPDFRGRGYGAALMAAALAEAPSLPTVTLASDFGRPVYERLGFHPLLRWTLWVWRERLPGLTRSAPA